MRLIPLTKGQHTIVDDEDYDWLSQYKWFLVKGRYAGRMVQHPKRSVVLMHRAILSAKPGKEVDHVNNNGLDNRRANLRIATAQENRRNTPKQKRPWPVTSQYKGVHRPPTRRKWQARIKVERRYFHLGCFATEIEAAQAYDRAARHYFGEFARLNFPTE